MMDMEIQKVEEPDESSNLNTVRGPSTNCDEEISETSYQPEEIKPYACCWNHKKPTTPEQRKGRRYACVALVAVVCFLISDISLHVSNSTQIGTRSPQDVCLGILLRAFVQILISLILGCTKRQFPWGQSGYRVLLIFVVNVGAVTTSLIISIDISGNTIPRLSSSLVFMLVPTFTWIFSMTLALENFNAYVFINLVMYILAAVLLTQPQVLFTSQPAQVVPILSMDVGFSWPISVVPLNMFGKQDPLDVIGILATLMVTVVTGYLMVLIHISKGQHWSVVGVWMGVGSIFGCVYYYWNHIGFSHFQWPSANATLVGASGISAIFGTLGTLLYLMVLQNVTPTSALLLRCLEWAMMYIFQLLYSEKIFNLGDLSACILMTLASANIALSLCCF
eukprot:TCALIF_03291-PA protein Name:"Protein of unknown function" AED:0.23 eAED:0.23 QI:125/0.8/0.83/1/0.8/0.83/6/321/392